MFVVRQQHIPAAYFDVAFARGAGDEFAAMILTRDRRAAMAYELAQQVAREPDPDRRRGVFDAIAKCQLNIGERTLADLSTPDPSETLALSDFLRLPDVMIVRSWFEAGLQRSSIGYSRSNVVRWYPQRELGEWKPARDRRTILIWAPDTVAELTAIHTFALEHFHADLVVVSQGGQGPSARARYVALDSPEVATLLSGALCVVSASIDDPSWTRALAEKGASVAAATTSGSDEVADEIALFEPWSYRSIAAAVSEALSRRSSRPSEPLPSRDLVARALAEARPVPLEGGPLVSIVVPTLNRREDLTRTLTRLKDQTYENFEIVVVNDGGESIADMETIDPRVRVIDRDVNVGVAGALNFGLRQARGKYVATVADDDELFPDHLMRLVGAMERSGALAAHSNILIRYEKKIDGTLQTVGYNASVFCRPLDRTEVYASSPVAGHALLFRRDALDRVGMFREDIILTDQEMQIRLSQISDFVHVPNVTGEWLSREAAESQLSTRMGKDLPSDLRRIFELHPASGRQYVARAREATLANVSSRPPGFAFPPIMSKNV